MHALTEKTDMYTREINTAYQAAFASKPDPTGAHQRSE